MNDQQVRGIGDVEASRINIRHGFDFDDDPLPVADAQIIYDGKYEQLNGAGLLYVNREIMDKTWRDVEDSPGWPMVHFIPKSEIGRRDPATVFSGPAPYSR